MSEVPRGFLEAKWLQGQLMFYPPDVPGEVFCVDSNSGADTNTGKGWAQALATIDAAVNLCTASQGDIIVVHPAHAENLGADSAVDVDKIGIQIIGLRHGRMMPTLTGTHADGDLKLAAASCSIRNIRFLGGIDIMTGIVEVSGVDCAILDCEYRDVTGQATDVITAVDGADRLLIDGLKFMGAAAAGANSAIAIDGVDDLVIRNFDIYGNFAVGAIDFRTTASARMNVHTGKIWTANAADIGIVDTITASTGFIGPDIFLMLTDNAANITEAITAATCQIMAPILVCNLAGEQGMAIDITTSTDA